MDAIKILLFVVLVILVVPVLDVSLKVPAGEVGPPAPRVSIPALKHIKQQCSGSGSGSTGFTCFWASRIRIHQSEVWIRIFLSSSKNSKKNLDSYCDINGTFNLLKNDVNV
jgi:hypothetical protein